MGFNDNSDPCSHKVDWPLRWISYSHEEKSAKMFWWINPINKYSLYWILAWVKKVTGSVLVGFVPPLSPSCPVSPNHHPSPPQEIRNGTCLISPQRSLNFHQIGSNQTAEWRVIPLRCPWFPASSAASQPWGGSDQSNCPNEDEENNSKEEKKEKKWVWDLIGYTWKTTSALWNAKHEAEGDKN